MHFLIGFFPPAQDDRWQRRSQGSQATTLPPRIMCHHTWLLPQHPLGRRFFLVGGFNPSEKYELVNRDEIPTGKMKKSCSKPPTGIICH